MATELRILSWCDVCLEAGEHTPGETLTVAAGVVPPFDVEVCPAHAKPLAEAVAVLAPLGRAVGKGVPKVPATPAATPTASRPPQPGGACPECGATFATRGSLRGHLRANHDKSLSDVGLQKGGFPCPECGTEFGRPQGLGVHMTRVHPGITRVEESA